MKTKFLKKAIGKFINNAPLYRWRGKTANLLGVQVARTLWQHTKHFMRIQPTIFDLEASCRALDSDGIITIPNFLPDDAFGVIEEEYKKARADESNRWIRTSSIHGLRNWAVIILPDDSAFQYTNTYLRDHPVIYQLVTHVMRRRIDYFPGTMSFMDQQLENGFERTTTGNSFLHADAHYPTSKVVLYLNDIDEQDAPFIFCYGSHRLSWSRLMLEYDLANRWANPSRYEQSEVINGQPVVTPELIRKYHLDPRPIIAPRNTLIVANHFGLHMRGPFAPGRNRVTLRMSFRYLDTPRYRARFVLDRIRPPYQGFRGVAHDEA